MGDHAAPGGNKAEAQTDADSCADDANSPHPDNVEKERAERQAGSLQHSLSDDGNSVKRFGYSHHAEHGAAEKDNCGIT